jgi:hypothetical protein
MTNRSAPGVVCDCGSSSGNNLSLPPTVTDDLSDSHLRRVNMILLEYARDSALLQSRAYDAVLKAISEPRED